MPHPLNPQQFGATLKRTGWIIFYVQLALAVLSGLVLLFALADPDFALKANNPISGMGLLLAIGGLLCLGLSTYWAFRYVSLGRKLQSPESSLYPAKKEVSQTLWKGFSLNAAGMLLTLLGVEAIVLALLAKALTEVGGMAIYKASQLIEPLDILVVQANIMLLLAQFLGAVSAFWLAKYLSNH